MDNKRYEQSVQMLTDKDWINRERAAVELGQIGDQRAVIPLINALKDNNEWVRANAAEALGLLKNKKAESALGLLLKDQDEWVCASAAEALGRIGGIKAVEYLMSALGHESEWVRRNTRDTLNSIANEIKDVQVLVSFLQVPYEELRASAAEALGRMNDVCVLGPLLDYYSALKDRGYALRQIKPVVRRLAPLQKENLKNFSHLFCPSCCRRPRKGRVKLGLFRSLKYACCPDCGTSVLEKGIEEVVGVIGSENGVYRNGPVFYVPLFDSRTREARYADVDRIEVWSNAGINYEEAVNLVVLELNDRSGRPSGWIKSLPVTVMAGAGLSVGASNMLKQFFGQIIVHDKSK